ncbi:DnaB-like helicase N-terminal domain-containing protein [Oscillibacter sp.]|uniref:DnaB-like helicase N-terminal domain-containing protein n=1 Tax=Oscillibacter sp. TaxID=1945593 RepID=UPI0028A98235|nr:DnaB-like helicase N-terminal domain-containing protein [Oscillibacter sp.]
MKTSPSELLNAQVSLLGSMLLDETVIAPILALVADSDFIEPRYRMIYLAIKRLFSNSGKVDAVTVNGALGNTYGDLLCQIMEVTPTAANWEAYAEQLKSQALLYHLQEIGNQLAVAVDPDGGRDLIDKANKLLVGRTGIKRMTMKEGFANFFDRHDGSTPPVFIRWGMSFLDQRIYAERGDMIVLALLLGLMMERMGAELPWRCPIWTQAILCGLTITAAEFLAGCVLNLWLGWRVWDYSGMPGNLLGQVYPEFAALWCLVSGPVIVGLDWMRYAVRGGQRPRYYLRGS